MKQKKLSISTFLVIILCEVAIATRALIQLEQKYRYVEANAGSMCAKVKLYSSYGFIHDF